uniref:Uncharacterized protein n=2 Tax=Caenorhabditis japonica TaxID=281687 RepID=A0A8R1DKV1_CAEJA
MASSRDHNHVLRSYVLRDLRGGEEPWENVTNTEAKKNVVFGKHLQLPESCPEKFRSFIHEKIFVVDPKRRVVMDDVVRFIEPIINEMHNASAIFVIEQPVIVKPETVTIALSPTYFAGRNNDSSKKMKSASKVLRRKDKKKDKRKKTAHPGNHNMIEK